MRFADVPKSSRPIVHTKDRWVSPFQRVLAKYDADDDSGKSYIMGTWITFLVSTILFTVAVGLLIESIISGISDNMTTRACYNNGGTEVVKQIVGMDDGYVVVCQG